MRDAPFCSKQSVKPPVDDPISRQIWPAGSIVKSARAPSSLRPARLAYFWVRLVTATRASSRIGEPALFARTSSTETSPARIMAWALIVDSARPRSTRRRSRRFLEGLDFIHEYSSRGELGCQRWDGVGLCVKAKADRRSGLHSIGQKSRRIEQILRRNGQAP